MNALVQAEFAAALLDAERPVPAGLCAWNGSDPARRFAVYRNNVIVSLVAALADTFPVLRQLVGDEFFDAMAGLYVRAHPPTSPVLAHYGEGLADWLAAFEPARATAARTASRQLAWTCVPTGGDFTHSTAVSTPRERGLGNAQSMPEQRLRKSPSSSAKSVAKCWRERASGRPEGSWPAS